MCPYSMPITTLMRPGFLLLRERHPRIPGFQEAQVLRAILARTFHPAPRRGSMRIM